MRFFLTFKYVLKKSSSLISVNFLNSFLAIFINFAFIKYVPSSVFGQFKYFQALISTLSILSLPNFDLALERDISKNKYGLFWKIFKIKIISSMLSITGFLSAAFFYQNSNPLRAACLILLSIFFIPYLVFPLVFTVFIAEKKFTTFSRYSNILSLTRNLILFSAVIFFNCNDILVFLLIFLGIPSIINTLYFVKCVTAKNFLKNSNTGEAFQIGLKLGLSEFIVGCFAEFDKIIIKFFGSYSDVAYYSIAVAVFRFIKSIQKSIITVLRPITSGHSTLGESWKKVKFKLLISFLISVIAAIPVTISVNFFAHLYFPLEYSDSIGYTCYLTFFITSFGFVNQFFQMILVSHGKMMESTLYSIILSIFRISTIIVLSNLYGIYGIIYSTCSQYFIASPLGLFLVHYCLNMEKPASEC